MVSLLCLDMQRLKRVMGIWAPQIGIPQSPSRPLKIFGAALSPSSLVSKHVVPRVWCRGAWALRGPGFKPRLPHSGRPPEQAAPTQRTSTPQRRRQEKATSGSLFLKLHYWKLQRASPDLHPNIGERPGEAQGYPEAVGKGRGVSPMVGGEFGM